MIEICEHLGCSEPAKYACDVCRCGLCVFHLHQGNIPLTGETCDNCAAEMTNKPDVSFDIGEKFMIEIITFGRGFVVAGEATDEGDGYLTIRRGVTIRRWGTSKGLGQLANGPLSGTRLDGIPSAIKIPKSAVHGHWQLTNKGQEVWREAIDGACLETLDD